MRITRFKGGSSTGYQVPVLPWLLLFALIVSGLLFVLTHALKPGAPVSAPAPVLSKTEPGVPVRKPAETKPVANIPAQSETDHEEVKTASLETSWDFLQQLGLGKKWTGDFGEMRKRRIIRALVVYSKTLYFLDGARERGATYDALKQFEKSINEKYKTGNLPIHVVFIPVHRDELLPGLVQGRGDIAAANLTITDERRNQVDFSDPVTRDVTELVVTGPSAAPISNLQDLSGQEVFVRRSSSYFEHLGSLNESFRKQGREEIRIRAMDENLETEDILEMVNAGIVPITVVDNHLANIWRQIYPGIRVRSDLVVHTGGQIAWAFRKNSPQLKLAANEFIRSHGKGTLFGNMLANKYFGNVDYIKNNLGSNELKRYKATVGYFKKYANQYSFDYLMMAAQGFQESGLDQSRVSRSGAVGVMQVKPTTAADRNVNIANIQKVDNNIHAGVKYMRFMMDYYFRKTSMDPLNRGLFAVASYNAGPNRIAQLREKARRMGLNPDVWFQNVEVVAAHEIGRETVQYVSNIFKYYLAYKQVEAKQGSKTELRAKL